MTIGFLCLASEANANGWQRSEETSALTDNTNVFWALPSANLVPNVLGMEERAVLTVMCYQNETRVLFDVQNYMGSKAVMLSYRIDKGKILADFADVSENGRVFGFWNGRGIPLLKQISSASNLVISAEPWNKGAVEAVFNISGINDVVVDVRKVCGW
jgi:type VI secretion system protein VasI